MIKWAKTYKIISALSMLCMQVLSSWILLRITYYPEIDDEGLPGLDEWALSSSGYLCIAMVILIALGLLLLGVVIATRREQMKWNFVQNLFDGIAGLVFIACGFISISQITPDERITALDVKLNIILFVMIFDCLLIWFMKRTYRKIDESYSL